MTKGILFTFIFLPIVAIAQNLSNNTNIEITKTWFQEPDGYTYPISIKVPTEDVPEDGFPVCILLHGNGGNGMGMVNQFMTILECHALVAPSGYLNSWNICGENSDAPDVEMVNDLVNQLQGYDNINPNKIRILGSSNGAALANRIFIENDNAGIDIICAIVSHLNEPQYHSDGFYYPSGTTDPASPYCGYGELANPLTTRKYLSISNTNDQVIPYEGGMSVVGVDFLSAELAAYNIAVNQGYTGNQLTSGTTMSNPEITKYSYLSDKVVHIKGDANHGTNISQRDYIKNYFSDCNTTVNTDELSINQIKIYPNPTNSIINIEGLANEVKEYSIFNVMGQEVLHEQHTSDNLQINLSELPPNVYYLKINERMFRVVRI